MLLLTSCEITTKKSYDGELETYIVKVDKINVTKERDSHSATITTKTKNDTIYVQAYFPNDICKIDLGNNKSGYVSYLEIEEAIDLPKEIQNDYTVWLYEYTDWKTHKFWLTSIVSIIIFVFIFWGFGKFDEWVFEKRNKKKKESLTPYIFMLSGVALSVLYLIL